MISGTSRLDKRWCKLGLFSEVSLQVCEYHSTIYINVSLPGEFYIYNIHVVHSNLPYPGNMGLGSARISECPDKRKR